ncbi:MAG: DUF2079 domain-containing protein [Chthoniobacterales bacterium]
MSQRREHAPDRGGLITASLAALFFLLTTGTSWAHWAEFRYRTFDLAYYVQALWQLIHGRFEVSVEQVPLLGNHVEPIVLLLTPLFFIWRHPMLFVVVQNAAIALLGPLAYDIARRLGFTQTRACLLAISILLMPATGYVALHEFHPEALSAPLLLWMLHSRLAKSRARYWLAFGGVLACKENMAPLLAAYCAVQWFVERKRMTPAELRAWFGWPMLSAIGWFVICSQIITPRLNAGHIDYLALYERLGRSGGEILRNAITKPELILRALQHSLGEGNLVPGLLLPLLGLPLLRPRWLLVAAPVLLQHLLSWRPSEWTIFFHYAAPMIPIFWIAAAEALAWLDQQRHVTSRFAFALSGGVVAACIGAQALLGPAVIIARAAREWTTSSAERVRKQSLLSMIPASASVVAPLPYLSHLANRRELHSLHYILKGLKTLSREAFTRPAPTEFVLIDYAESATFDVSAGFYHPAMRAIDGRVIPSSDRLLHEFLRGVSWESLSRNELTLLKRRDSADAAPPPHISAAASVIAPGNNLLTIDSAPGSVARGESFAVTTTWELEEQRKVFPWMLLRLLRGDGRVATTWSLGLCAPEARGGVYAQRWEVTATATLPVGEYRLDAVFLDAATSGWQPAQETAPDQVSLLAAPIHVGYLSVR